MRKVLIVAMVLFPMLATAETTAPSTGAPDASVARPSGDDLFVVPRHAMKTGESARGFEQDGLRRIDRPQLTEDAGAEGMTSSRRRTWTIAAVAATVVVIAILLSSNHGPKTIQGMSNAATMRSSPRAFTFSRAHDDGPTAVRRQ